jgi:hypothetical protein
MRDSSLKRVEVVTHSAEDNRFCLVEHLLNVGHWDMFFSYLNAITGKDFEQALR